jgi:hypothetical protein
MSGSFGFCRRRLQWATKFTRCEHNNPSANVYSICYYWFCSQLRCYFSNVGKAPNVPACLWTYAPNVSSCEPRTLIWRKELPLHLLVHDPGQTKRIMAFKVLMLLCILRRERAGELLSVSCFDLDSNCFSLDKLPVQGWSRCDWSCPPPPTTAGAARDQSRRLS